MHADSIDQCKLRCAAVHVGKTPNREESDFIILFCGGGLSRQLGRRVPTLQERSLQLPEVTGLGLPPHDFVRGEVWALYDTPCCYQSTRRLSVPFPPADELTALNRDCFQSLVRPYGRRGHHQSTDAVFRQQLSARPTSTYLPFRSWLAFGGGRECERTQQCF